ncbi:MAG: 50S ribosomal protein L15 [Deltaproteobacteria bacterium]|nr:50S ribosomal protein L15 [Deltaproteobacteria bacterium]
MLDRLQTNPGSRKARKRVGRGHGSGSGKTAGRGQKGAGSRSGHKVRSWFEGGQMPLSRRVPKVGFTNIFAKPRQAVNVKALARFEAGTVIDAAELARVGLVPRADVPVKVLGEGDVGAALTLRVDAVSATARQKLEAAGGTIEIVVTRRAAKKQKAEA